MECPKGHGKLQALSVRSIRINRCRECGGTWCDRDELRLLKDKESHGDYCWIDFDLWKDRDKFRASRQQRYQCPRDKQPMTTVRYGDFPVTVDLCSKCHGLWLDKGEYDEIVAYLERMVNTHTVGDYLNDLREEFLEIFTGPEGPISEMKDLDRVLYLLQLRFAVEHTNLAAAAGALPKY